MRKIRNEKNTKFHQHLFELEKNLEKSSWNSQNLKKRSSQPEPMMSGLLSAAFFFLHFFATPFRSIILGCKGWALRICQIEGSQTTKPPHVQQRALGSRLIFGLALRYTTPRLDFPQLRRQHQIEDNTKTVFCKGSRCWGCFWRQRCAQRRRIRWCRRCHAYSSRRRSCLKAIERSVAGKASGVLGMASASFFLLSTFTHFHVKLAEQQPA